MGKDSIRFNGLNSHTPQIHGCVGQSVEVRYMPHDDRTIEVSLRGTHLCTARPTGQLTAEQAEAFRRQQRDEAERLGRERREAALGPARTRTHDRRRHRPAESTDALDPLPPQSTRWSSTPARRRRPPCRRARSRRTSPDVTPLVCGW
ncbi:Mu transposase C-terminal domain-containing protein [Streptomyces sp. NPDC046161]|uniref:Mu transposase C-terminal domain-containing protein n=1 Tax=Streptomyces sp. NPDC046161 TaxID=3155132 RepID=UPI0033D523EA